MFRRISLLALLAGLLVGTAHASDPVSGWVRLNQGHFYSHQPLVVELYLQNNQPAKTYDIYVGLEVGDQFLFLPDFTAAAPKPARMELSQGATSEILISGRLGVLGMSGKVTWHLGVLDPATGLLVHHSTTGITLHATNSRQEFLVDLPPEPPLFAFSNSSRADSVTGTIGDVSDGPRYGALENLFNNPSADVPFLMGTVQEGVQAPGNLEVKTLDENPQHRIGLSKYYITRTEVTNGEYAEFIDAGGYTAQWERVWSREGWDYINTPGAEITAPNQWGVATLQHFGPDSPNHPVSGVSYHEAAAYAKYRGCRLPTEAEWEYAARGPFRENSSLNNVYQLWSYPWGNGIQCDKGHFWECGEREKAEVGQYPAGNGYWSDYGGPGAGCCFDMAGNVWEWTSDIYAAGFYDLENAQGFVSPDHNPTGPSKRVPVDGEVQRTWRGGSFWFAGDTDPRVPYAPRRMMNRYAAGETNRYLFVGFRLARNYIGGS